MIELPEIKHKERKAPYRKPEAVKILERLAMDAARKKYPMIPVSHLCPRTFRDDSANALTKCIVSYMTLQGAFSSRLNNTGVYDARMGQYRPSTAKRGLPDVLATYHGLSLFVEVKFGRDSMSEHQKKVETDQTGSGGLFFIAHDFTSFKEWFDSL